MALMFQRLAQNFIKKGFYPTDEGTISGILRLLKAPKQGTLRLLDPCCGEGSALSELAHYLRSDTNRCETYGVEIDDERAWHSKSLLDRVIHGDLEDCLIGKRQFSLMFFNPPYGDQVSDQVGYSEKSQGRARLEKSFYQRTIQLLQFGGIGITIIPFYTLDKQLSGWIARHYTDVQVYKAAVDQFKQIVIMGKRCRSGELETQAIKDMRDYLLKIGRSELEPYSLPESDTFVNEDGDKESILPVLGYRVPAVVDNRVNFQYVKMDPRQLQDEISRQGVLWERFELQFRNIMVKKRQPLRKLTDWHMALMLAAGHVNGIVTSEDGSKTFVIKGDTHKKKDVKVSHNETEDGSVSEVRTATDKFVPVIRAFDFSPGENYGSIVTIQ
jgi:hypothetical protein